MAQGKQSAIYKVAEAAGVSVMTVSRAMRGVDGVSDAKRQEILKIARALNYVPNNNARALSQANADLIGISLPTLFNDVFADVLSGMRGTIRGAGYATVIETSDYDMTVELQWVERLLSWRPAALVLTGTDHAPDLRAMLREARVPTLEIWDYSEDPIGICVGIDHRAAGAQIGAYVRELGYARPGFVGHACGRDMRADKRTEGFQTCFDTPLMRVDVEMQNSFRMGASGMETLLGKPNPPDVVFFLNDHLAYGGIMAAQKAGVDVPGDIGVVGFNGLDLNTVLAMPLTTVRTPRRLMGAMGARDLLAHLNGVPQSGPVAMPVETLAGATTRRQ